MNFIGIDLSWRVKPVKPQRTAAVVMNEKYEIIEDALLSSDDDIVDFIRRYKSEGCIVGIDAPLVVPSGLKQRECERMLLTCKIAVFPGNRDWFVRAFGGVRGEMLVERLKGLNLQLRDSLMLKEPANALFEIYPYAAWKVLFGKKPVPKYKNISRQRKIEGLNALRKRGFSLPPPIKLKREGNLKHVLGCDISELSNKELDQLGDLLDALMAAYIVLVYWHHGDEKCVVLGDLKRGFILTLANDCLRKMAYKRKY